MRIIPSYFDLFQVGSMPNHEGKHVASCKFGSVLLKYWYNDHRPAILIKEALEQISSLGWVCGVKVSAVREVVVIVSYVRNVVGRLILGQTGSGRGEVGG